MSYYGYPIDPEQLEKDKRKEREKRDKEREASLVEDEIIEDSSIDANIKIEENDKLEDEYIEVDCNWCTQTPGSCDKNCLVNLKEEYLATLVEEDIEDDSIKNEEQEKSLLNEIEKKAFCVEPSLLEKFKKDLSEEDYIFIKTDMIWYTIIFFTTFFAGLLLFVLGIKFNLDILLSLSILVLLSQNAINLGWKGSYWNYIKISLKSRKKPISYETILKEIPKYRLNHLKIPKKRRYLVICIVGIFTSILILIKGFTS